MKFECSECVDYLAQDRQLQANQSKIKWLVGFTLGLMVLEISVGYRAGSMSLVAEGWHMGSHVGALAISWLAYRLSKSSKFCRGLSFGPGKLIPLGGYTSAIVLSIVALWLTVESFSRLFEPVAIHFDEAIVVAIIGLVANVAGALILNGGFGSGNSPGHQQRDAHGHVHDHNLRSAFLHVLADILTSMLAVGALSLAKLYQWNFLDPLTGIVGAMVILSWSYQLCRDTGRELLDSNVKSVDWARLRQLIERDGTRINDFHIWRIAPQAVACELIVTAEKAKGPDYYRQILREHFFANHIVVEER